MSDQQAEKRVTKVLSFLAALYPKFTLTPATIKAYSQILADVPPDLLQAAAKDIGSRSTFFPAAAELRQAAFDLVQESRGIPSAYEAWEQVTSQYRGRRLEMHPLTQRAIAMIGGLDAYGMADYSTHTSWRSRFVDAYEGLARKERRQLDTLPEIAGYVTALQLQAGDETEVQRRINGATKQLRANNG